MAAERTRPIRVMLAEHQEMVRTGLRLILERQPDMRVVAEVGRADEVLRAVERTAPDAVVMEARLPGLDVARLTRELGRRYPEVRVVVLSGHPDAALLHVLLRMGAAACVLTLSPAAELCQAIRAVMAGRVHIDPRVGRCLQEMPGEHVAASEAAAGRLSHRERQVLQLIALGYTQGEIAQRMGLSVKTVETYRSRIAEKVGLRTRAEMVRFALSEGLLEGVAGSR